MSAIRYLADSYEQSQRLRVETGERIRAVLQARDATWPCDGFEHGHEAGVVEKPESIERAEVRKKPEKIERAVDKEEPEKIERAVLGKKPVIPERARTNEEPEMSKRAADSEQPETGKRKERLPSCDRCDAILNDIRLGKTEGPVTLMGRTYRRHWEGEREAYKEMRGALESHPAWPWVKQVKGVGDTLACRLLARLDVRKAATPSAFWAYCGLATVPGLLYRCQTCGLERAFPADFKVTGNHTKLGSTAKCKGSLEHVGEGRAAMPRPRRGEKAGYDQAAKKTCYLIAMQFVKVPGSPYEQVYRRHRQRLDSDHPGWADGRRHFTALRKTAKLFLSHLWLVWREAEGLPVTKPYAQGIPGHEGGYIGPWEMVE